jgi:hypothetical protein
MKRVAREPARWAGIKAHLEGETGAGIHDANLANLPDELLKAGFLGDGGDLKEIKRCWLTHTYKYKCKNSLQLNGDGRWLKR